ncbi:neutral/alkaline non-lysosomal ceramidase N-terminal domain-containing protein, partial [bacterium]|nr:neutral/alkaline non-lysosomal ceramidase N-terminal domain-containing protein [bacterium]
MATVTGPVGVVGLGYVGLPLAAAFAQHLRVVGFDVNTQRVDELRQGIDRTGEIQLDALQQPNLAVTADPHALQECPFVIIAVPTEMTTMAGRRTRASVKARLVKRGVLSDTEGVVVIAGLSNDYQD